MESARPATEMAARSAIVYLETRPGRFKLHNFVIFSSVEPTFLHQLHQLRQLLAHLEVDLHVDLPTCGTLMMA